MSFDVPEVPRQTAFTMIALHGNGGGACRFARIGPYLPSDVRFCPVTLPGFAAYPRDPALHSLRDYARYLHDLVTAEPRPLVVLGHGIGGSLVLEFLQLFAADVDGVILHAPVGTRLASRLFPRLMALPGACALGQRLFTMRLLRPLFRRLLFSQPVPAADLERFFEAYRRCAVFAQMFTLITPAWFSALRPVMTPAALLWGARERVLRVDHRDDYLPLLPRCIQCIVPHWDHFPMLEQPAEYASTVVGLARQLLQSCASAHPHRPL